MKFFSYFSVLHFSNCYLLGPDEAGDAVLIDPGIFDEGLLRLIEENRFYVRHVLLTHAHHGHTNGLKTLLRVYEASVHCFDTESLDGPASPVSDGSRVECGPFSFQTIETPGHSSDSVCYRTDRLLFTGDTLSACAVGTAPTPFERALLLSSIRTKLLPLEQELLLFPGHGPPSTLAVERAFNPYLKEQI